MYNTMTTADTIVMIVMTVEYEESTNQILGHPRLFLNINQKSIVDATAAGLSELLHSPFF